MSDRTFLTSAGQTIVVPSDEPDTLEVLKDYARRNGLDLTETTPSAQQQSGNPVGQTLKGTAGAVAQNAIVNKGTGIVSSILGGSGVSPTAGIGPIASAEGYGQMLSTSGIGPLADGSAYASELAGAPATGTFFSAPYAMPAGAAGAYGLSRMEKLRYGGAKGALGEGASGAAAGYAIAGAPGAIVGGTIGAIRGYFHGPSRTKKEQKDRQKLAAMGIKVDNAGVKEWENNAKFKESRNESDLTGNDIKNSASLYLRYGKDYSNLSNSQRAAIAQAALDRGLVREHLGRIDIAYDDDFDKAASALMVAKPQTRSNNGGTRKASPDKKVSTQSAPESPPGKIIPGPAVTVDAGGPSPYQPNLITPQDYAAKYREMLAQRGYQGLQ